MGIQLAEREQRVFPQEGGICPTTKSVPGSGWAKIVTAVNGSAVDGLMMMIAHETALALSNTATSASLCMVSYANLGHYGSDFVSEIRAADSEQPEATFDNVVDMLDWLNRE